MQSLGKLPITRQTHHFQRIINSYKIFGLNFPDTDLITSFKHGNAKEILMFTYEIVLATATFAYAFVCVYIEINDGDFLMDIDKSRRSFFRILFTVGFFANMTPIVIIKFVA